jgi:hypothetical protein
MGRTMKNASYIHILGQVKAEIYYLNLGFPDEQAF